MQNFRGFIVSLRAARSAPLAKKNSAAFYSHPRPPNSHNMLASHEFITHFRTNRQKIPSFDINFCQKLLQFNRKICYNYYNGRSFFKNIKKMLLLLRKMVKFNKNIKIKANSLRFQLHFTLFLIFFTLLRSRFYRAFYY